MAAVWAESWGPAARPVHLRLLEAARIDAGMVVLDIGCGTGEFLAAAVDRGAHAAGIDPAAAMVDRARRRAPTADVRVAAWDHVPWPDASIDVVVAVNSLQYADVTLDALAEARRVVRHGGLVAVANWAERELSDLETIDSALAAADGEDPPPDGDLRVPGGLDGVLRDAGFDVVDVGTVEVPWVLEDAAALVRAVLLDDVPDDVSEGPASYRDVVIRAAEPFLGEDGRYVLKNTFRYAIGRSAGGSADERNAT